jgi:hypothetical protein
MHTRSLLLSSALACWAMLACPGGQSGDEGGDRSVAGDGNASPAVTPPYCRYVENNGPDLRARSYSCVTSDPLYTSGEVRWQFGTPTPPGPYDCTCADGERLQVAEASNCGAALLDACHVDLDGPRPCSSEEVGTCWPLRDQPGQWR